VRGPNNVSVVFNTVHNSATTTAFYFDDVIGPLFLRNNIVISNNTNDTIVSYQIGHLSDIRYIDSDYNILKSVALGKIVFTFGEWQQLFDADHHSINQHSINNLRDMWINPIGVGGDYHLSKSSAAINAGVDLPWVPLDADGLKRPQGKSSCMGAYEFPVTRFVGSV